MSINGLSIIKKIVFVFLIIAGLIIAKTFLIPLAIGGVLATLFLPLCRFLEKHRFPKFLAVFICLLALTCVVAFVFGLLGWKLSELTTDFILIKQRALNTFSDMQNFVLKHFGIANKKQIQMLQNEQPSLTYIMQMVAGSLSFFFSNLILVFAYFFLILFYRNHLQQFLIQLTSSSQKKEVAHVFSSAANVSQQYLLGLGKMIVCLWIMYGIGFSILGVKNALFFAFLCGLLEIVPYIGNITGTVLTLLMATVQGVGYPILIGIVSTYGAVQFIQGWVLEPLILGPQVKINPLFSILSLVVGQLIWGIAGMFLAIPILAMLKIIFDHVDTLKPYGFLIGEINNPKTNKLILKI